MKIIWPALNLPLNEVILQTEGEERLEGEHESANFLDSYDVIRYSSLCPFLSLLDPEGKDGWARNSSFYEKVPVQVHQIGRLSLVPHSVHHPWAGPSGEVHLELRVMFFFNLKMCHRFPHSAYSLVRMPVHFPFSSHEKTSFREQYERHEILSTSFFSTFWNLLSHTLFITHDPDRVARYTWNGVSSGLRRQSWRHQTPDSSTRYTILPIFWFQFQNRHLPMCSAHFYGFFITR